MTLYYQFTTFNNNHYPFNGLSDIDKIQALMRETKDRCAQIKGVKVKNKQNEHKKRGEAQKETTWQ